MKKILYNKTLFFVATVIVLASLILSTLEYIDLGLLIIPMVLPYLIWLFILMRLVKKNKWNASGSNSLLSGAFLFLERWVNSEMKDIQEKIKLFCENNELNSPVEHRVLDTMSELGEVAKEILKMSNYGKNPIQYNSELKMELGDVLFSIITIANAFEIDLEEALNKVLKKYEKRIKKGSSGSENDWPNNKY